MKKKTIGKEYIFTALILFVVLAVTMVLDSQLPSYHIVIKVIKKASVYSLVAVSMNLLNGFTGLFSLGQAGFMLLGAYAYAVLSIPVAKRAGVYQYFDGGIVKFSLPEVFSGFLGESVGSVVGMIVALMIGGLIAALVAYLIGLPVLRLKSDYLAIATLGFADPVFYHYDIDVGQAGDFVGHSLARKTITLNGQRTTIVAVILRGGGYGGEWVSNLHTGVGAGHAGFVIPVNEVLTALRNYLARAAAQPGGTGTVKLWVGGYSRGAAVANLLAGRINKELPEIDRKNVFVYTFATPVALTAASYPDYQLDYDNNHNADGTLKTTWAASNIYNILSSGDLVPRVLPAEWGYHRNGNDRFLPSTQNEKELADLDVRGASFSEVPLTISGLATKEDTDGVMERLETFFGSKQQFHDKYEAVLMDMIQCAFLRSEAECTQGYLLTDEEVEARLRGLGNMRNVDEAKLEKSVHNASALSRPLLEKLEQNDGNLTLRGKTYHVEVPQRVKQAVIPVLAVGLYYGIDSGTVAAMARYIFMFMSMKPDSADVVVRAAFCHHCEDYISLMEYYPPADHGMEAYTRA